MNILLSILAIIPGLLICFLIYKLDKFDREPIIPLIIAFALGAVITIPTRALESYLDSIGLTESENFFILLGTAFVAVAFVEEFAKFFCVIIYAYPQKFFSEPLDGMIYALMVAMGFATIENILYAQQFDATTLLVRAFTAVPAHGAFAVLSGYYIGLARFSPEHRNKYLLFGFGLAVFAHGLYDFFILQLYFDALIVLACVVLLISLYFARKLFLQQLALSASTYQHTNNLNVDNTQKTTEIASDSLEDQIIEDIKKQNDSDKEA